MNKTRYNSSLRYICIALGLITVLCMIMVGQYVAHIILENKDVLSLIGIMSNTSERTIFWGIIGIFTFLGLLMFMNLLMHGLNYNKYSKMQVRMRRQG